MPRDAITLADGVQLIGTFAVRFWPRLFSAFVSSVILMSELPF